MLERLIDALISCWYYLKPAVVIPAYSEAVVFRLGKYHRTLKPGIHFKFTVIDEIHEYYTVITTISLPPQSLFIQKSKTNLVVKGVIKYKIVDGKTFFLTANAAKDALADVTQGIIKRVLTESNLDECFSNTIDRQLTKHAASEAKKWGVEVQAVTLTDIAPIRSYRLFNETSPDFKYD